MADVFISYSKNDVADARMLAALLEANNYTVWWDTNLEGGEQFRKKIAAELAAAHVVIVIWTKSSVASDWVQSEAGRALADQKLVPVRSPEIDYNEIPPPFENRHTVTLGQKDQIVAAVASQLAKPVGSVPGWKVFRYELLLWAGAVGGAITLTNMVHGLFTISAALSWVLSHWSALLRYLWQVLFLFQVNVSAYDAELLTVAVLLTSATVFSMPRQSTLSNRDVPYFSSLLAKVSLGGALFVIYVIMIVGAFNIAEQETNRAKAQWSSLLSKVFKGDDSCRQSMRAFLARRAGPNGNYEYATSEISACHRGASTSALTSDELGVWQSFPPKLNFGVLSSLWSDAESPNPSIEPLIILFVPMLLPVIVATLLGFLQRRLELAALSRRLWRTLGLLALLLGGNYIALNMSSWTKTFPKLVG